MKADNKKLNITNFYYKVLDRYLWPECSVLLITSADHECSDWWERKEMEGWREKCVKETIWRVWSKAGTAALWRTLPAALGWALHWAFIAGHFSCASPDKPLLLLCTAHLTAWGDSWQGCQPHKTAQSQIGGKNPLSAGPMWGICVPQCPALPHPSTAQDAAGNRSLQPCCSQSWEPKHTAAQGLQLIHLRSKRELRSPACRVQGYKTNFSNLLHSLCLETPSLRNSHSLPDQDGVWRQQHIMGTGFAKKNQGHRAPKAQLQPEEIANARLLSWGMAGGRAGGWGDGERDTKEGKEGGRVMPGQVGFSCDFILNQNSLETNSTLLLFDCLLSREIGLKERY